MAEKTVTLTVTAPRNLKAGEEFEVTVALPERERKPRGILAGIAIEDMTDEQLKREIINSKSVLYKAKQRGAKDEVVVANQKRVDLAVAERDKRRPVPVEAAVEDGVFDKETAEEI